MVHVNLPFISVPFISVGPTVYGPDAFSLVRWWLRSRLTQMSVDQFFHELDAFELHKLHIPVDAAVQRHADLPWARKDVLVLYSRLVVQPIGTGCGDALDDMQFITMVIADPVEP